MVVGIEASMNMAAYATDPAQPPRPGKGPTRKGQGVEPGTVQTNGGFRKGGK